MKMTDIFAAGGLPIELAGLKVARELRDFIREEALLLVSRLKPFGRHSLQSSMILHRLTAICSHSAS